MNNNQCVYLLNKLIEEPKAYVGSTINIHKRFKVYKSGLTNRYVEKVIAKNGWDSFQKIEINVNASNEKELRAWEGFYIGLFGTYKKDNPDFGMNIIRHPTLAISKEPSIRRKISEAAKYRKVSEETKKKISDSCKGKINIGVKRPYLSERNKIIKPALGRTGEKHPMSKKVLCISENLIFDSIQDFGDYLGLTRQGAKYKIQTNPNKYKFL